MKKLLAVSALAALLSVPAVWAQSGAAGAPTKVGVINVQIAITSTAEGKQAAAELQSKFAPRQTDLDNMRKQLDDLQTRLRTGQTTLSDDEKARLLERATCSRAPTSANSRKRRTISTTSSRKW